MTALSMPDSPQMRLRTAQSLLAILLVAVPALAILTLWISAYWPTAAFEILIFALATIALALGMRPSVDAAPPMAVMGFIVLWGCIQLLAGWSTVHSDTVAAIWKWVTWLAVFYLGSSLFADPTVSRGVRTAMVWFGFALAVEVILQAFLSPNMIYGMWPAPDYPFVMGPIPYHTHFAALMEVILPMTLWLAFSDQRRTKTYIGIAGVLLAAVVVSASRGGLILVVTETVLILVLLPRRRKIPAAQTVMLVGSFAGCTAVLMLVVGWGKIVERFRAEALLPDRLPFIVATLHMIRERPWTGFGMGCWPSVYPAFALFDPGTFVNQAHCDWLQWVAEGGLPVGVAMIALAIWAWKAAWRSIWALGAIAVLLHASFDYPFSRPAVGAWVFLTLAMAAAIKPARDGSSAEIARTAEPWSSAAQAT
ncbi:MAG: O-antigen ligase family protein, partial [Acidobacteriaceae bacterium]